MGARICTDNYSSSHIYLSGPCVQIPLTCCLWYGISIDCDKVCVLPKLHHHHPAADRYRITCHTLAVGPPRIYCTSPQVSRLGRGGAGYGIVTITGYRYPLIERLGRLGPGKKCPHIKGIIFFALTDMHGWVAIYFSNPCVPILPPPDEQSAVAL